MIYTSDNAFGAIVFALNPVQRINRVVRIDTQLGLLWTVPDPVQIDAFGEIVENVRRFTAIWPIFGGSKFGPVLFHCRGELPPVGASSEPAQP